MRVDARKSRGFSLIEILVAMVVFAAMAAITWGALSQIARARSALVIEQDRFAGIVRAMTDLERDLRQAISRPVRGNYGEIVPALLGSGDRIELSRLGYANPRAEQRSNVERVLYAIDDKHLRRGRHGVLDRAAGSVPEWQDQVDKVGSFRLRYLNDEGAWLEQWPPRDTPVEALPRAIEFRLTLEDFGELRRVVALPSSLPLVGVGANGTPEGSASPVLPDPLAPVGSTP
ncbi:MAG: type II secretion system minor pseudopilin GspJ [Dokdonella sp.]|uniref:type II secretion system minor pseudopilin GspJ n=1 Tax=Dokdonella sp. TaxID=2291710 RepID=UPI002C1F8C63|nr:type II secretion system minor pseudopilin GspJ [Dokdonella sp.]HOX71083.1 type II secretion system minor pseudopilin GspJ [Dokdonella sp.]HPG95369.1 type II secretion system minor pseudopilin GspJ [Dokdonella sp.]